MRERRLRKGRLGLVALAAATLAVAAIAGYVLGAAHRAPALRRLDAPAQSIEIGALQRSVVIPALCPRVCPQGR